MGFDSSLEKYDIDELPEHQPRVELGGNVLPLVSLAHFHLQLLLPPLGPFLAFRVLLFLLAKIIAATLEPAPLPEESDDPPALALLPQNPGETKVVRAAPEDEVDQEEG